MLFSHPADFTPVCTTELGRIAVHNGEFKKRNVKLLSLSCDKLQSHKDWVNVCIRSYEKSTIPTVGRILPSPNPSRVAYFQENEVNMKGLRNLCGRNVNEHSLVFLLLQLVLRISNLREHAPPPRF